MAIAAADRDILRRLAGEVAEVAALDVFAETIAGWKRMNSLQPGRPMVWINEIPWHEMDVEGELTLRCTDPLCREHEQSLRRTLYQWRHMPADMVVEPVHYCPLVVHDSGLGLAEDADVLRSDPESSIVSRRFHGQIQSEADLARIRPPVVRYDSVATERNYQALQEAIGDLLPVRKRGAPGFWFAPWDWLIRIWGVQQALEDLVLRPDLVHRAMDRLVGAYLHRLDQYEALGLLASNNGNVRVGSGGLGYTDELPQPDGEPGTVRPMDQWGCATAQIFSDVSPAMHEEFALQYERRWLERFGLNYYGCCEPLHLKIDMLRRGVPRLRKVSISPRADAAAAARQVGTDLVLSLKPNPAVLATDAWNPEAAREDLRTLLESTRGCAVEIIMKDISTVRYQPQRLWEWAAIAREEAADLA